MPKTSTARDRAVELEQDAVRYPEERGEILLEAAEAWKEAGEPDRAVALWRELIEAGGEDAGFARYGLVELCFEQARDAEAWEHLQALEDEPADAVPESARRPQIPPCWSGSARNSRGRPGGGRQRSRLRLSATTRRWNGGCAS